VGHTPRNVRSGNRSSQRTISAKRRLAIVRIRKSEGLKRVLHRGRGVSRRGGAVKKALAR